MRIYCLILIFIVVSCRTVLLDRSKNYDEKLPLYSDNLIIIERESFDKEKKTFFTLFKKVSSDDIISIFVNEIVYTKNCLNDTTYILSSEMEYSLISIIKNQKFEKNVSYNALVRIQNSMYGIDTNMMRPFRVFLPEDW